MALLEIACFDADHAILAFNSGADRIELCDNRDAGGTTPSFETLLAVKQNVSIPVYAMIRPKGGQFCYDDAEFRQMRADIDRFKSIADGFVFGILNDDSTIDGVKTAELVQRAAPLPCTFHRAFDETLDQRKAFEDVIATGCHALLSSGGCSSAISGAILLRELVQSAKGRITVIPGGGVRAQHLLELQGFVKARVYHSSGIVAGRMGPDPGEIRRMKTLLREQPLAQLATIDLVERQSARMEPEQDQDNERPTHGFVSAVSTGASTPVESLSNRLE